MLTNEFDFDKDAIIKPSYFIQRMDGIPKIAVSCFENTAMERLVELLQGQVIATTKNANSDFPVYKITYKEKEIALFMMDMGAAGAGAQLEEIYTLGIETVILFGSCGALDKSIQDCSVIIPDAAVRDEGLSYHYAPPSDEIKVNLKYIPEFTDLLDEVNCSYRIGKTWTTDAFYRETKEKMARRKNQGCLCVEMECSALAAVAQFREKELFQFLYTADCLEGEQWDKRSLGNELKLTEKDTFGQLALELAVRIEKK